MTIVGLPTTLVRFFKGYLPLPPLPKGARITDVRHGDGELAVTFADRASSTSRSRRTSRGGCARFTRLPIPGLR